MINIQGEKRILKSTGRRDISLEKIFDAEWRNAIREISKENNNNSPDLRLRIFDNYLFGCSI